MKNTIILFILAVLFSSCSKEENPVAVRPEESHQSPIGRLYPKSNSVQITQSQMGKISSFTSYSITFSDNSVAQNLKSGDVIFSEGYISKVPRGFLRKVTSVSGNTVNCYPASLDDAFSKGDLDFTISPSSLQKSEGIEGIIGKSTSPESKTFSLACLIYDKDGNNITVNDQLKLEGSLNINGWITGGIHFPSFKVNGSFNLNVEVDLNLIATGGLSYSIKKNLFIAKGTPLIVSGVVLTPEFSVEFSPLVSVEAGAKVGINDKISINHSVIFDSKWGLSGSFQNKFLAKPVEMILGGKLKGTLSFKFSVSIYELAGLGVNLGPYLELQANPFENPWWIFYAGLGGDLFVESKPLSFMMLRGSWNLFDARKIISQAQSSNKPPTAMFYITPEYGTTETNFQFSAKSSIDLETPQSQLICRWDFEGDNNWDTDYKSINELVFHQYSLPNYYNPKLEVKDGGGLTDTLKRILNVSSSGTNETLILQPGPEGEDAEVDYIKRPDGSESYYGFPDSSIIKVHLAIFTGGARIEYESLLRFNLSGIQKNSLVKSAKLKVYGFAVVNYVGQIPTISLVKLMGEWTESTVKWNSKPHYTKIIDKELTHEGFPSWYEFDVSSVVQKWVNGETNYGFGLRTDQNTFFGEIYSSDNSESSKRPILGIIYQK